MALLNDAGKLRHRCTFMTMKEERTPRGTVREIPVELFTCWCAFTRHSIRDVKEAVGTGHDIRKTIIIRHRQRHDIDNTMKVKIKENTRNRFLFAMGIIKPQIFHLSTLFFNKFQFFCKIIRF